MFITTAGGGMIAATALGGLLGGGGKSSSQTSQATVDPRIAKYLYGADGNGGLLGDAQNWYQNNKSGMSAPMTQAANDIWNQNNANHQGYDAMQGVGMKLLGGGVAGNPFAGGYTGGTDFSGGMNGRGGSIAQTQMSYTPPTRTLTDSPFTYKAPEQVAPASTSIDPTLQSIIDEYKRRSLVGYDQRDNLDPNAPWQANA